MIHHVFGISTEVLVGWAVVLFVPMIIVTLLLVNWIQNRQLKQGQAAIMWRLGMGKAPRQRRRRGNVVQGPWENSG